MVTFLFFQVLYRYALFFNFNSVLDYKFSLKTVYDSVVEAISLYTRVLSPSRPIIVYQLLLQCVSKQVMSLIFLKQ